MARKLMHGHILRSDTQLNQLIDIPMLDALEL